MMLHGGIAGRDIIMIQAGSPPSSGRIMLPPPKPRQIIGRGGAIREVKRRLGLQPSRQGDADHQPLVVIRGWPGVGKTTLTSALAFDEEINEFFSDGILWTSLGAEPDLILSLESWGRAIGEDKVYLCKTVSEASALLAGKLSGKKVLLLIDDVWKRSDFSALNVAGAGSSVIVTTRLGGVAQEIAHDPSGIYKLDVLAKDDSLKLFEKLSPQVVELHRDAVIELVEALEGLPLAIQVAGRMLQTESGYGFGVQELLSELKEGSKILASSAPGREDVFSDEALPTVSFLLQKSTDRLDEETRERFAYLGMMAPKPASFDAGAMAGIWRVQDPKPTIRTLVDRGLLEPIEGLPRYQMHSLVALHAKQLCTEG